MDKKTQFPEKRLSSLEFIVNKLQLSMDEIKALYNKTSGENMEVDDMLVILLAINKKLFGDDRECINPIGLVLYYYFLEDPDMFNNDIEELKEAIKVYDTLLMWYEGYAWVELDLSIATLNTLFGRLRGLKDLDSKTAYTILAHYNNFNFDQTDEMFESMKEQGNANPEGVMSAIEALETLTGDISSGDAI